jgi:hypothetical protein
MLKRLDGRAWAGLICLRKWTSDMLLKRFDKHSGYIKCGEIFE